MPLIHSKRPAAFKKNIETEMRAGKPQKQAVAIAYSEKRDAERHKYSGGGYCYACGGAICKYAEGGGVNEPYKESGDEEYADSRGATHSDQAHGRHDKGGMSKAGERLRAGKEDEAYADHYETLSELRSMRKPKLYAEGGKVDYLGLGKAAGGLTGVHGQSVRHDSKPGQSRAGDHARAGLLEDARGIHGAKLEEMRGAPRPTSGKGGFAEGGGVEPDSDLDIELSDGLGRELMDAMDRRDYKSIMSCIEAAVAHCMNKGEEDV
jgi:hypothetical protein